MARPGLTGHRKFRRLERTLGSRIVARGVLELLWETCYESGNEYVGTAEDIESLVGWAGEPGKLADALLRAGAPEGFGFIEPVDSGQGGSMPTFKVHDLWHHAPDYVAKRHKRELERQSRSAPSDSRTAPNGGHCQPTPDCQDGDGRTPSPSPAPSPSPGAKSGSPEPPSDSEPSATVAVFSVVGKGGPEWALPERLVDSWLELYPTIDVMVEIRKAVAWIAGNPGRRKTASGMPRFLVNWLNRATDRGGPHHRQSEREFTQQELQKARDWKRAVGYCPHDPTCASSTECMALYIRERLRLQASA